jgi:hypothetical protein
LNSTEWMCTECGNVAKAYVVEVMVHAGWWIFQQRRGLCPACVRRLIDVSAAETVQRARELRDAARETLRLATEALGDNPKPAENTTRPVGHSSSRPVQPSSR